MHLKTRHHGWPPTVFYYYLPFSLLFYLFIYYLFWTNKLSRAAFGYQRAAEEFWLTDKCQRSICSHGTVQYFCSVQTELRNTVEFQPLSVVLPPLLAKSADLANPKMTSPSWFSTHQCTHSFTVQQLVRLLSSHLASHAGVFREACISPLLKNACSTDNNISHCFTRVTNQQF